MFTGNSYAISVGTRGILLLSLPPPPANKDIKIRQKIELFRHVGPQSAKPIVSHSKGRLWPHIAASRSSNFWSLFPSPPVGSCTYVGVIMSLKQKYSTRRMVCVHCYSDMYHSFFSGCPVLEYSVLYLAPQVIDHTGPWPIITNFQIGMYINYLAY